MALLPLQGAWKVLGQALTLLNSHHQCWSHCPEAAVLPTFSTPACGAGPVALGHQKGVCVSDAQVVTLTRWTRRGKVRVQAKTAGLAIGQRMQGTEWATVAITCCKSISTKRNLFRRTPTVLCRSDHSLLETYWASLARNGTHIIHSGVWLSWHDDNPTVQQMHVSVIQFCTPHQSHVTQSSQIQSTMWCRMDRRDACCLTAAGSATAAKHTTPVSPSLTVLPYLLNQTAFAAPAKQGLLQASAALNPCEQKNTPDACRRRHPCTSGTHGRHSAYLVNAKDNKPKKGYADITRTCVLYRDGCSQHSKTPWANGQASLRLQEPFCMTVTRSVR